MKPLKEARRASFLRRHPVLQRTLLIAGTLLVLILGAMVIADSAIRNPDQAAAFSEWMEQAKYGWLMWRLAIYGALTWGFVKILYAPGFRSQYRQPLMRIAAVSVIFALVCELVLLSGPGAS
ncbi:hypothetical protein [Pantoea agglomerans]|uniref:hypothetical protein n=1 Tax=Enterobacter agglomerans TaxID=549 RepID=UPI002896D7C3|nr:hypothetical protein [Pantoea agglomerans]WNK42645.1 hypothetical protein RM160_23350 [Pantoea agglomerans]